jgi:acyl-CoA reductase-like NAD-dependent aldehyde dehydrogenase
MRKSNILFWSHFWLNGYDRYTTFYPDSPSAPGATSRIISLQAFTRLKALLDNTKGTIAIGGEMMPWWASVFDSSVVRCPSNKDYYREIFGPILPIVPVDSLDEAIAYVNAQSVFLI